MRKKSHFRYYPSIIFTIALFGSAVLLVYSFNYFSILNEYIKVPRTPCNSFTKKKQEWNGSYTDRVYQEYLTFPGNEPLALTCGSCAYVTGSGHLRGSNLGKEIDSKDCVIRSNDAPTKDFENDVGKRTTIRTADRNSLRRIINHAVKKDYFDASIYNETVIVLYGYPQERNQREEATRQASKQMPSIPVYLITNKRFQRMLYVFDNRIEKNEYKIWFTNGFVSLLFMQDICDEIHVYGVVNSTHCSRVNSGEAKEEYYHYYPLEGRKDMECSWMQAFDKGVKNTHHYTKEKQLFEQLRQEWGNLYFHAPEWTQHK